MWPTATRSLSQRGPVGVPLRNQVHGLTLKNGVPLKTLTLRVLSNCDRYLTSASNVYKAVCDGPRTQHIRYLPENLNYNAKYGRPIHSIIVYFGPVGHDSCGSLPKWLFCRRQIPHHTLSHRIRTHVRTIPVYTKALLCSQIIAAGLCIFYSET